MAYQLKTAGVYIGKIVNWYRGRSQNGSPYVEFVIFVTEKETLEGERVPLGEGVEGFSVNVPCYMTIGALPITLGNLAYLGFTSKDPGQLDRDNPEAFDFKGKEVYLRCDHETYNGKEREKWNIQRRKRPATAEERKAMDAKLAPDFARVMSEIVGEEPAAVGSGEGGWDRGDFGSGDNTRF